MRTEVPVCKRCCFCVPLRYGLLTWGYLKLMAGSLLSIALSITLYNIVELSMYYGTSHHTRHIIMISAVLSILLLDVVLTTVFIVGGHKKNVKLLQIYYFYSIAQWMLTVLIVLGCTIMVLTSLYRRSLISYQTWIMILDFSSSFVNIMMHTYFVLLLRSEIVKLKSNCEFQFVNNAAEAECTMKYKERIVNGDTETGDIYEEETKDVCGNKSCGNTCQNNGTCCSEKSVKNYI